VESKRSGLETCDTLGMLTQPPGRRLKAAASTTTTTTSTTRREYYGALITTRASQDRLDTLGQCATTVSRSAGGASSAWAGVRGSHRHDSHASRTCPRIPNACRSIRLVKVEHAAAGRRRLDDRFRAHHQRWPAITMPKSVWAYRRGARHRARRTRRCASSPRQFVFYGRSSYHAQSQRNATAI